MTETLTPPQATERKRAYRYEVTETGGDGTRAVGESPYIIDWKYLGKTYTWNIVGGPASRFASLGFISGRYIDKGHVGEDGKYVSDKDAAAASARTKEEA
jgi:hypothetical protein